MGRNSSGAWETGEAHRIEIRDITRLKVIQPGKNATFSYGWKSGGTPAGEIAISAYSPLDAEPYLVLNYKIGEESFKERIEITYRPSNLSRGKVPYFICPVTGKLCRILYRAYGLKKWMSRDAYRRYGVRIFYSSQTCSKLGRYNTRYWNIDKRLGKDTRRAAYYYSGKPTRRFIKTGELRDEKNEMDLLRWTLGMPISLQKKV